MSLATLLFWGAVLVVVVYLTILYNGLVQLKHDVAKAWANIDVLLKQRHDELPKLVEVCKQYKQFEQTTLERVVAARSQVQSAAQQQDIPALGEAEAVLRQGVGRIFAVAEAYPELRANESFMQLQSRISQLENAIADRREFYNESVNINNIRVEQLPDAVVAKLFHFESKPLLEFASSEKSDVDIKALFN